MSSRMRFGRVRAEYYEGAPRTLWAVVGLPTLASPLVPAKRTLQIPVMNISWPPSFISSPPSRPSSTSHDSPLLPSYHPRPEQII